MKKIWQSFFFKYAIFSLLILAMSISIAAIMHRALTNPKPNLYGQRRPPRGQMQKVAPNTRDDEMAEDFPRDPEIMEDDSPPSPVSRQWGSGPPPLYRLIISVVSSTLVTSLISLFVLLYVLRKKKREAEYIIDQLKAGNLKARFVPKNNDEFSALMLMFNQMAEQIEANIERITALEKHRVKLMQELGHDLRTPLAALSNFVETGLRYQERLSKEELHELFANTLNETRYISELIEDLFVFSLVSDQSYEVHGVHFDIKTLLEEEVDSVRNSIGVLRGGELECRLIAPDNVHFKGDPNLLRRAFRNLLQNSAEHSTRVLRVEIQNRKGAVVVKILDDGKGFPEALIDKFGMERFSKDRKKREGSRKASFGLGSIVARKVIEAHGATLRVFNHPETHSGVIEIVFNASAGR